MNREIKFRAWNGEQMIYEEVAHPFLLIGSCVLRLSPHHENDLYEILNSDKYKIMQFTGLLDKNGKEIFEGDILKSESGKNIAVVEWGEYRCKIKGFFNGMDNMEMCGWIVNKPNVPVEPLDESFRNGEIIGNIHSNPDLLK